MLSQIIGCNSKLLCISADQRFSIGSYSVGIAGHVSVRATALGGNRSSLHSNTTFGQTGKILFGLMLYVPVNNFSIMSDRFPGLNQY